MTRLDGVEGGRPEDHLPLRWLLMGAAVVLLAVAVSIFFVRSERALSPAELAEVQRLLEQTRQLEDELTAVRHQVHAAEPVLYLEGLPNDHGDQVDLLVEISTGTVETASYRLH
jgi:hypothetical protein